MKITRKIAQNRIFILFIIFSFLFASCSKDSINNEVLQKMSSEDIFRAIIFKEGELGKKLYNKEDINLLENLDSKILIELTKIKSEIINEIKKKNPNYFLEFKNQINSNNHVIIMKTIEDANIEVKSTVSSFYNIKDYNLKNIKLEDLKNKVDNYNKDECVAFVLVVIVAILLMIPVVSDPSNDDTTILEKEQVVNKLINYQQ